MRVRHRNHGAIQHIGMAQHGIFDFSRGDVLSPTNDEFLESARDGVEAVPIATSEIPRPIPSLEENLCSSRLYTSDAAAE